MNYARMLLPAAMRKKDDSFTIDLAITADNLQFGVTPYWNAGGWCNILDWGDGQSQAATTPGTQLTHTYTSAGSYRVKVRGDMYRFRVGSTNPAAVIDCNGNWEALGDITSGRYMFSQCTNATLSLSELPAGLTDGNSMFSQCANATLSLSELPAGLTDGGYMFYNCRQAVFNLRNLPAGLTSAAYMFSRAYLLSIYLDDASNIEYPVNNASEMFYQAGSGNTPGTVTGHIATFMRKCPNVNNVGSAFSSTNTTTFGDNDYFEITLTTTEANQSWGFTATSSAGRWYCFDWGDGTAVTSNKNLDVFTSGTKVSHTFATPGTYHIKLATAPCTIVFDAYDSDNGNWAALGQ